LGNSLDELLKTPMVGSTHSINDLLVTGLVELCKVKPVGLDAVSWLGEWLVANNPSRPCVEDPDDQ
jgi:hypothetical protein